MGKVRRDVADVIGGVEEKGENKDEIANKFKARNNANTYDENKPKIKTMDEVNNTQKEREKKEQRKK